MSKKNLPLFMLCHNEKAMPGEHYIFYTKAPCALLYVNKRNNEISVEMYELFDTVPVIENEGMILKRAKEWYIGNVLSHQKLYK
ncbi:MAG TPA: hypothetical protein PL045_08245 [Chitinophagaceae bacterium]|nr:hypothetical protein [Chitinophagaceae bacterium]